MRRRYEYARQWVDLWLVAAAAKAALGAVAAGVEKDPDEQETKDCEPLCR